MNWKEFLKPDYRKIVIFALLLIFINLMPIYTAFTWFCQTILEIRDIQCYDKLIFISLSDIFKNRFQEKFPGRTITNSYINISIFFLAILVMYLLSCIIVWFYDKKFKKVKKR